MKFPEMKLSSVKNMVETADPTSRGTRIMLNVAVWSPLKYSSHQEAIEAMAVQAAELDDYGTNRERNAEQFLQFVCNYAVMHEMLTDPDLKDEVQALIERVEENS